MTEQAPRILIVDSSGSFRTVARLTFEKAHYNVGEAKDGESALALLSKDSYHAVISEVVLSGLDGFALLQAFRVQSPRTPFFFLTTHGGDETKQKARQLGATGFITKPYQPSQLVAYVGNAITSFCSLPSRPEPLAETMTSDATPI